MGMWDQKVPDAGGDFEIPPAGNHPAVLIAMIDLGTHTEDFQGKQTEAHKVFLVWELTEEKCAGYNRNHVIGRDYTLSLHEKAGLRKMLEGWRGRKYNTGEEINVSKVLGQPCFLNVSHKTKEDRTY